MILPGRVQHRQPSGPAQIAIEPVNEAQAYIAHQVYRDFRETSGHRARLNFGDCFS